MTMRISDPRPDYCSCCHNTSDSRHVDMNAMHDGGAYADRDMAYIAGTDSLHLCEACVRTAAETLAYKPDLHARQFNEIKRLELSVNYWRERAHGLSGELQAAMAGRPDDAPPIRKRRKVAA